MPQLVDRVLTYSGPFSAILSAFLIEVRSGLQSDPQETTNDRPLSIFTALTNSTAPLPLPANTSFSPPSSLVIITSLWFTSLAISLIASLGAISAKTWILEYGEWMTARPPLPQDDALPRHRRYLGTRKWQFAAIISAIPILIHIALFLFLAGLIVLLWNDNATVVIVMVALVGLATMVYVLCTALPLLFNDCPLSTPLSPPLCRLPSKMKGIWMSLCTLYLEFVDSDNMALVFLRWIDILSLRRSSWQAKYVRDSPLIWILFIVLYPTCLATFLQRSISSYVCSPLCS
jgi:hypothetical protein